MHIYVLIVVAICCATIGTQEVPPFPVIPSAFSTVIEVTRAELVRNVNLTFTTIEQNILAKRIL